MARQTTYKQLAEAVIVQFDFAADMASDETLSAVSSLVAVNQGEIGGSGDVTITSIAISTVSTQVAQCVVSGGTNGELYKMTAIFTTSAGQTLEADGYLRIRNT